MGDSASSHTSCSVFLFIMLLFGIRETSPAVKGLGALGVVGIITDVHVGHARRYGGLQHAALRAPLKGARRVHQQIHTLCRYTTW